MNPLKIALLTDSCADIPKNLLKKYDIYSIPLKLLYRDGEYLDGVTIQPAEVYRRLPHELPKTSLPDGALIEQTLRKIQAVGYEKVLAIHLSSGLSGTCNVIRAIGAQFVGLEVAVFDSCSGSLGIGMTVLQTARLIAHGYSWAALLHAVPMLVANTTVFFCVNTLEYLQKGGRIGRITAVAGTLLQVKPIISFTSNGELVNVAKVRGRKQAIQKMTQMVFDRYPGKGQYCIAVANGDCKVEMLALEAELKRRLPNFTSCFEGEIDCTLGAYVGPHLLGAGIQLIPDSFCEM